MRNLTQNKKGDWIQIFAVLFFVLLVVVAYILLTLQAKRNEPSRDRELTEQDLDQQYADALLITILRTPVSADLNKDGAKETVMLSEIIAIDRYGAYDEEIRKVLSSTMTGPPFSDRIAWELSFIYPGSNSVMFYYPLRNPGEIPFNRATTGVSTLPLGGQNVEARLRLLTIEEGDKHLIADNPSVGSKWSLGGGSWGDKKPEPPKQEKTPCPAPTDTSDEAVEYDPAQAAREAGCA